MSIKPSTARRAHRPVVPLRAPKDVLELRDGATASIQGGALELRDPAGRLLVRYADGCAEISAPAGDLTLNAPSGRVVIRSATDVTVEAARDVVHHAGRRVELGAGDAPPQIQLDPDAARLRADKLEVEARDGRIVLRAAAVIAGAVTTTAQAITVNTERYELVAARIVERARDAFRDIADLAQTRAGRARTLVADAYDVHAKRATIVSEEETKIDGSKVLLG